MKDIVIIGGGIVGLWCARYLRYAGMDVTILDQGDFTGGCSYGNAGMIVPSHFTPLASPGMMAKGIQWMFRAESPFYIRPRISADLLHWLWRFYRSASAAHVAAAAPLLRDMHEESRLAYEELTGLDGYAFDFQRKGILMLYRTSRAEQEEVLMAEHAHTLGVEAIVCSSSEVSYIEPGLKMDVAGGVYYPGDAHLNPGILMDQLRNELVSCGVHFKGNAKSIRLVDHQTNGGEIVLEDNQKLKARYIVVAAGSWSGQLMKRSGTKMLMMDGKGYSMTLHRPDKMPSIPALLHEARVAVTPMHEDLRISGTFEISGMDDAIRSSKIKGILEAIPSYYPEIRIENPGSVWYGYRPCTPDGMPYIGRVKSDSAIVMATGHAMMGLSLAPSTGRMVRDVLTKDVILPAVIHPMR